MTRRVLYLTGTRADFGLMLPVLNALHRSGEIELGVIITGAHLHAAHGSTSQEVYDAGLPVIAEIPTTQASNDGRSLGQEFGDIAKAASVLIADWDPSVVLTLGDRAEMLATAGVAVMQNKVVAHIHGGERSGTIDELFRHAITKLSHVHFASTQRAADRIVGLGERPDSVIVSGAPGLDTLTDFEPLTLSELSSELRFNLDHPFGVLVFHPVVQKLDSARADVKAVVRGANKQLSQVVVISANADPGGAEINTYFDENLPPGWRRFSHLNRKIFLSLMARAAVMVGNSSAGIIEAASLGLRVINIGSRQRLRERGPNVVDCEVDVTAISLAVKSALANGRYDGDNIYGQGNAAGRIVSALETIELDNDILNKVNAY